jgi:hypothetical protein
MSVLIPALYFLLLASLAASLITYAFFWYENGWRADGSPEGKNLRETALRGLLSSFAAVLFTLLTYPLALWTSRWKPKPPLAPGPLIVLTHGIFHNAAGWLLFSRHLRKAGFRNIFFMQYGSFFTNFENTYEKFQKFVTDVSLQAPDRPLYLIGHSLVLFRASMPKDRSETMSRPPL